MRNISFPSIDDKDVFHKIALAKRRKRGCRQCVHYNSKECDKCVSNNKAVMIEMESYINNKYDYYDKHLDCLGDIKQEKILKSHQKDLLINTFKSNEFDGVRKLIIDNLPNSIKGMCPFCMIGEPATLEHYLPKDLFPEYTLYSKNLIPCCHICNSYKSVKYVNENGSRSIINFYIDDIENKLFLKSVISLVDGIPTVDFVIDLNKEDELYETIITHFEYLHLFDRYVNRANSIISSIMDTIGSAYSLDDDLDIIVEDAVSLLTRQTASLIKQYGKNYWKASIIKGIIEDQEVLREMINNYLHME